eukprot:4810407-Amphidinium_carterae.1
MGKTWEKFGEKWILYHLCWNYLRACSGGDKFWIKCCDAAEYLLEASATISDGMVSIQASMIAH